LVFFETAATVVFDINFIVQIIIIALVIFGVTQKPDRRRHGSIMAIALIINLVSFAIVMLPQLFFKWDVLVHYNFAAIILIHAIIGAVAISSGLIFSIRFLIFLRRKDPLNCGTKMEMRLVNLSWLVSFILGVVFYFIFYTTISAT